MKPWSEATDAELRGIKGVCLDIDDTLSTRGKLTADAFAALWRLKDAGLSVIPVTGRPAGWCDHIARFWPVDAVVGENGAFTFYMEGGVRKRLDTEKKPDGKKLEDLARAIQKSFPEAKWASDQSYREYDLAIDFCEDVEPWPEDRVKALVELCKKEGGHAKVSSIHVNAWFGNYDKATGLQKYFDKISSKKEYWIYVGDSPNDEPLFEYFDCSVGVANLKPFLGQIRHTPKWMTAGECGAGVVEVVNRLAR